MTRNATSRPDSLGASASRRTAKPQADTPPLWETPDPAARQAVHGWKLVAGLNVEMTRFLARRAGRNSGTIASLARCTSPLDALDVWREAAVTAIDDYAEEASRILSPPKH